MDTESLESSERPSQSQGENQVLPMPVYLAATEVIELFISLLCAEQKGGSGTPSLRVKIRSVGQESEPGASSDQVWFQLRVKCQGPSTVDANIQDFVEGYATFLTRVVQQMEKLYLGAFCFLDSPLNQQQNQQKQQKQKQPVEESEKTQHRIFSYSSTKDCLMVQTQQLETKCAGHCFTLKVLQEKFHMISECHRIHDFLHKLKIFYPELPCHFTLNIEGTVASSQFCQYSPKINIGSRKMSTDIQHYLRPSERPEELSKIHPRSGSTFTLPHTKVSGVEVASLKLTAVAALVPPLLQDGVTADNAHCTSLKMLIYGPGSIPVIVDGVSQLGLNLSTLVKLEQYGLTLDKPVQTPENSGTVPVDWHYTLKSVCGEISNAAAASDQEADEPTGRQTGTTIYLCLLLDRLKLSPNGTAIKMLGLLDNLRQNLVHVLCKQRTKVRKAIGSALNKLLFNYTLQEKKQELLSTAVPNITKSLQDVVKCSTNNAFRSRCFHLMQVDNSNDLGLRVKDKLWTIAKYRYDVIPPQGTSSTSGVPSSGSQSGSRLAPFTSSESTEGDQPKGQEDRRGAASVIDDEFLLEAQRHLDKFYESGRESYRQAQLASQNLVAPVARSISPGRCCGDSEVPREQTQFDGDFNAPLGIPSLEHGAPVNSLEHGAQCHSSFVGVPSLVPDRDYQTQYPPVRDYLKPTDLQALGNQDFDGGFAYYQTDEPQRVPPSLHLESCSMPGAINRQESLLDLLNEESSSVQPAGLSMCGNFSDRQIHHQMRTEEHFETLGLEDAVHWGVGLPEDEVGLTGISDIEAAERLLQSEILARQKRQFESASCNQLLALQTQTNTSTDCFDEIIFDY